MPTAPRSTTSSRSSFEIFFPSWRPPADRVGETIETDEQLAQAIAEIGAIGARQQAIQAAQNEAIHFVNEQAALQQKLRVGRQTVNFCDRLKQLYDLVEEYSNEHREELLPEGSKTRELSTGAVSWTITPARVAYEDGLTAKKAGEKVGRLKANLGIEGQPSVADVVAKQIEAILFADAPNQVYLGEVVKVSFAVLVKRAGELYAAKKLTAANLRRLGLQVIAEDEVFRVTPYKIAEANESNQVRE